MTPRDFCSWFEGVLDMAVDGDGGVGFNPTQTAKIYEKLKNAMAEPPPRPRPKSTTDPFANRPPGARC